MVDDELEPLITRCPSCGTQFRVTENQLAVASGRVRCGACLTVFQGIDHLLLDEAAEFASGSEADAALDALLDELEPDRGAKRSAPAATPVAIPPSSPLFGGFDDENVVEEPAAASEPSAPEPASLPTSRDAADEAETPAEADVEAEQPSLELSRDDAWPDEDYRRWIAAGTESLDQMVQEVVADVPRVPSPGAGKTADDERGGEAETGDAATMAELLEPTGGAVSFAREPTRWWIGVVAGLCLILLAGQIFYLQLPDWSRDPDLRPAYEWACRWLGCELSEMRSLESLRTRNLVVRSHPEMSDALIVDAAIVNMAPFEQRFPDLEIRFTSVDGALVAGRRFRPEEYLRGEFSDLRLMPPNTPIQVSVEIVDPGREAVNYTLSFR